MRMLTSAGNGLGATTGNSLPSLPNALVYGPAGAIYDGGMDLWTWFKTPSITAPPSPAYSTPVAPQTEEAMKTWTPAMQEEAYAQRGVQYNADTSYFSALFTGKTPVTNTPVVNDDSVNPKTDNTMLWVLAGVAGVLLFTTVARR